MAVSVERREQTAVVRFARPPVNAFDLGFVRELGARLDELAAAVPSAGLVLTGDGAAFSAGVDFKAVPSYGPEQAAEMISGINAAVTTLYGLPTATVAALNGHAIGGALVVALACDARLAADTDAKLGLTEVTAGIPYPACPIEVVQEELDAGIRRRLVLSGELIDPRAALAGGIVDELVAPERLLDRALELARERAAAASYAVVKAQLKGARLARMREIVAAGSDPMLAPRAG